MYSRMFLLIKFQIHRYILCEPYSSSFSPHSLFLPCLIIHLLTFPALLPHSHSYLALLPNYSVIHICISAFLPHPIFQQIHPYSNYSYSLFQLSPSLTCPTLFQSTVTHFSHANLYDSLCNYSLQYTNYSPTPPPPPPPTGLIIL